MTNTTTASQDRTAVAARHVAPAVLMASDLFKLSVAAERAGDYAQADDLRAAYHAADTLARRLRDVIALQVSDADAITRALHDLQTPLAPAPQAAR